MVEIIKEFQCFFVRPPFKLYFRLRPATKSIKTASGAPRPKSAPRGSKSTTFAKGIFQPFNFLKLHCCTYARHCSLREHAANMPENMV